MPFIYKGENIFLNKECIVAMETKWQQKFITADKISKKYKLNIIFEL